MAVTLTKPKPKPAPAETQAGTATKTTKATAPGWMKKGKAAKQAFNKEEAKAEQAKAEKGKLWRFWMPEGQERTVTFLDGDLDEDGMLDVRMFYEHTVFHNGNWENYVCLETIEAPCPICEGGDKNRLVGVMTVIDHTEHTIQKGPNAGKVVKDQKKLYVAGRTTLKQLAKLAAKRGGSLAGCTFEISREGDKSPNVGNMFDFVAKNDLAELKEHFGKDDKGEWIAVPADYEKEFTLLSADDLLKLGIGKPVSQVGSEKGIDQKELEDAL